MIILHPQRGKNPFYRNPACAFLTMAHAARSSTLRGMGNNARGRSRHNPPGGWSDQYNRSASSVVIRSSIIQHSMPFSTNFFSNASDPVPSPRYILSTLSCGNVPSHKKRANPSQFPESIQPITASSSKAGTIAEKSSRSSETIATPNLSRPGSIPQSGRPTCRRASSPIADTSTSTARDSPESTRRSPRCTGRRRIVCPRRTARPPSRRASVLFSS